MEWLIALVKLGVDVAPYVQKLAVAFSQPGGPTDADVAELTAMEAGLDAELQAAQPDGA